MTPYYADDLVTLYHGRCEDVLPSLGRFDLVFTSPPYNLGASPGGHFGHWRDGQVHGGAGRWTTARRGPVYDDHDDAMPPAEYERWQRQVLAELWGHTTDQGAIFYNHKPRVQAETLWLPLVLNPGLPVRQIIVWARAGGINAAATHYAPTYEWIVVFARPDWRLRDRSASGVGDVWRLPQEARRDHPAAFPVGLPARAIETTAPRHVLDPFAGSGSTLVAAKAARIPSVGIELSERYCERAALRLSQEVLELVG